MDTARGLATQSRRQRVGAARIADGRSLDVPIGANKHRQVGCKGVGMIKRILLYRAIQQAHVVVAGTRLGFSARLQERRHRNCRQQSYDRDDNHDFHQCESLFLLLHLICLVVFCLNRLGISARAAKLNIRFGMVLPCKRPSIIITGRSHLGRDHFKYMDSIWHFFQESS